MSKFSDLLGAGLLSLFLAISAVGFAHAEETSQSGQTGQTNQSEEETFSENEIIEAVSGFFGVTSKAAAQAIERVFADNGRPNAYITGEEGAGAFVVGARYGKGTLRHKNGDTRKVYWQGPSVGFDVGGNAAKVFTLVYNLHRTDDIYQRFPGVEGTVYFVAGIGVNYQQAGDIILAPMRTGVGWRAGANVGYLAYTRKRNILPF